MVCQHSFKAWLNCWPNKKIYFQMACRLSALFQALIELLTQQENLFPDGLSLVSTLSSPDWIAGPTRKSISRWLVSTLSRPDWKSIRFYFSQLGSTLTHFQQDFFNLHTIWHSFWCKIPVPLPTKCWLNARMRGTRASTTSSPFSPLPALSMMSIIKSTNPSFTWSVNLQVE